MKRKFYMNSTAIFVSILLSAIFLFFSWLAFKNHLKRINSSKFNSCIIIVLFSLFLLSTAMSDFAGFLNIDQYTSGVFDLFKDVFSAVQVPLIFLILEPSLKNNNKIDDNLVQKNDTINISDGQNSIEIINKNNTTTETIIEESKVTINFNNK